MKVNRQNINESYNITSGWVSDFAKNIEKNADFLANVRGVFKDRNSPKTIEEKMADIKDRVGYSAAIEDKVGGHSKSSDKTASNKSELVRLMSQLIDYIKKLCKDRVEMGNEAVLDHCRRHPSLSWEILSPNIDHNKLKKFISKQISSRPTEFEPVEYIEYNSVGDDYDDSIPEFMRGPSL
tara:strand:- start:250 stop:792 length:543 start_codon:yes stop_codon:yes gene_type:complete